MLSKCYAVLGMRLTDFRREKVKFTDKKLTCGFATWMERTVWRREHGRWLTWTFFSPGLYHQISLLLLQGTFWLTLLFWKWQRLIPVEKGGKREVTNTKSGLSGKMCLHFFLLLKTSKIPIWHEWEAYRSELTTHTHRKWGYMDSKICWIRNVQGVKSDGFWIRNQIVPCSTYHGKMHETYL